MQEEHPVLEGEANIPAATKVVYGPNKAFTAINQELDEVGAARAFIITGNTLANKTDLVPQLAQALGKRCVGIFDSTRQHTPRSGVIEAARMAKKAGADILVGVGGGSPIIGTKGTALVMAEGEDMDGLKVVFDYRTKTYVTPKLTRPKVPVIAIPTTLSAGEFSEAMGITNDQTGMKDTYLDAKVVPRTIILDPVMTTATPLWLWASTGVKALQNAIERYYSRNRSPFHEGLCLAAVKIVFRYLKRSVDDPTDLFARGHLQFLNWMTVFGGGRGGVGLGHAICHQLGSVCNVPHGISGCIVLPHTMEFNRPVTLTLQRDIAEAMGIDISKLSAEEAAVQAVGRVRDLVASLGLTSRLRDAGVKEEQLPTIAEFTFRDRSLGPTPRPPRDVNEVVEILRKMF
ncbi:MAG: iron-containing alcohol dehydrogenase [Chloroflexi bacterium]|nr:iron-containing alcohol dehydrogenase [Chloroflexota bacterium]